MVEKGQIGMVGGIILAFVAIIVGAVLLSGTANQTTIVTDLNTVTNQTFVPVSSTINVTGYMVLTSITAYNASNGVVISSGNWTQTNKAVGSNGQMYVKLDTSPATAGLANYSWNLTYTGERLGYSEDGGTRGVTGLILIMFALGIVVIALVPALRNGVIDLFD